MPAGGRPGAVRVSRMELGRGPNGGRDPIEDRGMARVGKACAGGGPGGGACAGGPAGGRAGVLPSSPLPSRMQNACAANRFGAPTPRSHGTP